MAHALQSRCRLSANCIRFFLALTAFCIGVGKAASDAPPSSKSIAAAANAFYRDKFSISNSRMEIELPPDWAPGTTGFIEFTPKGNGVLQVGRFSLRVYDDHADPIYYKDRCLHITFLAGPNHERLISLSGVVREFREEGKMILDEGELLLVYEYDPKTQHVKPITRVLPFASSDYLLEKL